MIKCPLKWPEPCGHLDQLIFCWVCAAGISEPIPHFSQSLLYFVAIYTAVGPILVTFGHYSPFLVYFVVNYRPHLSYF